MTQRHHHNIVTGRGLVCLSLVLLLLVSSLSTCRSLSIPSWLSGRLSTFLPKPPLKNYPRLPDGSLPIAQRKTTPEGTYSPKLARNLFYQYRQGEHCPYLGVKQFDSIAVVQHWPVTLCQYSALANLFCDVYLVKASYKSRFSLLGLRGMNLRKKIRSHTFTQCCDLNAKFDFEDMVNPYHNDTKRAIMKKKIFNHWPDFIHSNYKGVGPLGLYAHEWIKYGTCLSDNVNKFAKFAIKMKKRNHIYPKLKAAGITRSSKRAYAKSDILNALKIENTGKGEYHETIYPTLICVKLWPFTKPVLFEVWNCYDRATLQPMNCTQGPELFDHTHECKDQIVIPRQDILDAFMLTMEGTPAHRIDTFNETKYQF